MVTRHPGLVPRGSHWYKEQQSKSRLRQSRSRQRHRRSSEEPKGFESGSSEEGQTAEAVTNTIALDANLEVENFWQREVFTCGYDGRPAFCSTCYNWKPDRAHHCSELDRCVLKMDHFCPWVGGVVGETSFKNFVQFTFWAALLCTHILVSIAYYFAQRKSTDGSINVHWAVILGISGLFLLFSAGMCMSSLQFVFINSTTIENLSRKRKVWYLAVHIPPHILQQIDERGRSNLRLITYPRPALEQFQLLGRTGVDSSPQAGDNNPQSETVESQSPAKRTFAILETTPGSNPFDLGWKHNFVDLMGHSLLDWLLPIHYPPCTRHDTNESFYKMSSIVDQLKHEARISNHNNRERSRHRRRRRSKHEHTKDGDDRNRSQSTRDASQ